MDVDVQQLMPGSPPQAVSLRLSVLATPEGPASVHYEVDGFGDGELLAAGARLHRTLEGAADDAGDTLAALFQAAATLVEPFPTSEAGAATDGTSAAPA